LTPEAGHLLLAGLRAFVLAALLPFVVRRLPLSARLGLAVLVATALLPAALGAMTPGADVTAGLLVREALLGAVLALLAGSGVWAAEVGGRLVDAGRAPGLDRSPLGDAAGLAAVVLLLGSGAHHAWLSVAADGYRLLPPDRPIPLGDAALADAVAATGAVLAVGFAFAVPAFAAALAVRGAAALAGRARSGLADRVAASSTASLAALGATALAAAWYAPGLERVLAEGLAAGAELLRGAGGAP